MGVKYRDIATDEWHNAVVLADTEERPRLGLSTVISAGQLYSGYTCPADGFITASYAERYNTSSSGDSFYLYVNGIIVGYCYSGPSNQWQSGLCVSFPVSKGDRLTTSVQSSSLVVRFSPYKV